MKVRDLLPEEADAQTSLENQARSLARQLDRALNTDGERRTGFALLLFSFGEAPQPATWISNADRGDMILAMEEWLKHAKGRS